MIGRKGKVETKMESWAKGGLGRDGRKEREGERVRREGKEDRWRRGVRNR